MNYGSIKQDTARLMREQEKIIDTSLDLLESADHYNDAEHVKIATQYLIRARQMLKGLQKFYKLVMEDRSEDVLRKAWNHYVQPYREETT